MGIVSCFGNEVAPFYQALLAGTSGVKLLEELPSDQFPSRIGAPVAPYDISEYVGKKRARRIDKFIAYALTAAHKAFEQAALVEGSFDPQRAGVVIGSGMGGMATFVDNVHLLEREGAHRVSPFLIPYILTNMAGGLFAQDKGLMGPNYSISTACATSNHSIISAAKEIRAGNADLMVCGGSEAALLPIAFAGFSAAKALSQRNEAPERASRPWDRQRDGFVMGEGAAVLILESFEHAHGRQVPILAEYLGGAFSCDAYDMTKPHPDGTGVALCIQNGLQDAGISPEQVNYVNAHATSTPVGDMAEIRALQKLLPHFSQVAINATKSMIGHCLGAAGALEAVATISAMQTGLLHPTYNLEEPEEGLGFYAPTQATPWEIEVALSTSFGFGGHNAVLLLAPYRG